MDKVDVSSGSNLCRNMDSEAHLLVLAVYSIVSHYVSDMQYLPALFNGINSNKCTRFGHWPFGYQFLPDVMFYMGDDHQFEPNQRQN